MEVAHDEEATSRKRKAALSLACEVCRKRKVKCSGKPAPCATCSELNARCVFPTGKKARRTPVRSSRRIDGLEVRLGQIEALLQSRNGSPSTTGLSERTTEDPAPHGHSDLSRATRSDITELLSQPSDRESQKTVEANRPEPRSILAPQADVLRLVEHYFATSNRLMPLFEESRVLHSFRDRHECLHVSDPLLWAAGNVVLALSLQSNVQHDGYGQQDQDSPTVHFVRKAMSVTDQLCTIQPTRLTAQVLIGIAKVWQSTSTPQAATFFLAMAVKQIHLLGLDVDKSSERDNAESGEWSRRVLWHAYTLDKDFSLRLEQPLSLKDEDIDAAMPSWSPKDGLGSLTARDDAFRINYFRIRSNLGLIQARIYNRLYSRQSLRQAQPDLSENAESVCDLVNMLLAWKSQVPIEFAAMSLTENFSAESMVALVVLYLHYFNCMMVAHRLSFWSVGHLDAYKSHFENIAVNPCPSHRLCIESARRSLQLFHLLPKGNTPCMWLTNDFLVSAVVILLAATIYGSFLAEWQDVQLVEPVVDNLAVLAQHGDTDRLQHIHANCTQLLQAAKDIAFPGSAADIDSLFPEARFKESLLQGHDVDWLYPPLG